MNQLFAMLVKNAPKIREIASVVLVIVEKVEDIIQHLQEKKNVKGGTPLKK